MPPSPAVRRLFLAVALLLLLGLAWTGLHNGLSLLAPAQSIGQKVQAFTQMAVGVFGFLGVVTTFFTDVPRQDAFDCVRAVVVVWLKFGVCGTLTRAMALLIAWAIIWLLRKGLAV